MPQMNVGHNSALEEQVARAVAAAAGRARADLLLKNARIINVVTGETLSGSVVVAGPLIAGVGPEYDGADAAETRDLGGAHLAPGLIDGHLHIESSLVTPAAYAEAVAPRGVTGLIWDPHEIANVAGIAGIRWCIAAAQSVPMSIWIDAPSCVPSTSLETAGASLGVDELDRLLQHPAVIGVGELMSYPAVVGGDPQVLAKAFLGDRRGAVVDGHAPGVSGRELQAYLAAGVGSDHECTELEEARAKLRAGAFLKIRDGSATRNLEALLPLLTWQHADRIGFVTDDRLPEHLLTEGGVDHLVRSAIARGVAPELAVRAATWNTARYFRLQRRGAVAPGYFADLIVIDDLARFSVRTVYQNGRHIAEAGQLAQPIQTGGDRAQSAAPAGSADAGNDTAVRHSVRIPPIKAADLELHATEPQVEVRCIEPVPDQILTREVRLQPKVLNGTIVADPERDIAKLVCVERHGKAGGIGVALVKGLGLLRGAIAGTVAHDHHNVLAAGVADEDIVLAIHRLGELGGGLVVVADGAVTAELALPIAGLLSDAPLQEVDTAMRAVDSAAADLGVAIPAPFMTLSFLGLPVIPELRLTDLGLIDVNAARVVPLTVGSG